MPRRTRSNAQRNVKEKTQELDDAAKKKYDSILEDFDKQMEARIQAEWSRVEVMASQIRNATNIRLLQLHKEIRQMKATEFLRLLQNYDENGECIKEDLSEVTEKTNKRMSKRTVPSTVRRSTRKRTPASSFKTPLMSAKTKKAVMATPLTITTKFDAETVFRVPRPNETLVSLTGSPVIAINGKNSTVSKIKAIEVTASDEDLDDLTKKKLMEIQSQISVMLGSKD